LNPVAETFWIRIVNNAHPDGSEYYVNNNSHLLSPLIIRFSNNATTNVLVGISFLVLFEYNLYIFIVYIETIH